MGEVVDLNSRRKRRAGLAASVPGAAPTAGASVFVICGNCLQPTNTLRVISNGKAWCPSCSTFGPA